ncbi:MAG: aspartate aminotransferase family protein, partial [Pyrinomonadaceae bacterium]|nr:aspartate aminotransferase family protein [Pyrinomonadaceae bacterium]
MKTLLQDAAQRAIRYYENLDNRGVAPSSEALKNLEQLRERLPEKSSDPETVLALLDKVGSPATTATTGGRFFGFVTGGAVPAALAANWLAGAWDQNAFSFVSSPVAVTLEEVALGWLIDILALPTECGGALVTGATMANFTALAAARNAVLKQFDWNVEAEGLFNAPEVQVIVGAEAHPTLLKALAMLGLGHKRLITVPVDGQGRMRADAIAAVSESRPAIICIQAGNVNTGAFDPAEEICEYARSVGAWVHVDGAFGLWAAASPLRAHLVEGFAGADSWATDAHKWLNVPYDSGLAFVRQAERLKAAMSISAAYLPEEEIREPMHYTPEASRRARGVEVWAALRSLGHEGVAELVERNCRSASRFAEGFKAAGYQ